MSARKADGMSRSKNIPIRRWSTLSCLIEARKDHGVYLACPASTRKRLEMSELILQPTQIKLSGQTWHISEYPGRNADVGNTHATMVDRSFLLNSKDGTETTRP